VSDVNEICLRDNVSIDNENDSDEESYDEIKSIDAIDDEDEDDVNEFDA